MAATKTVEQKYQKLSQREHILQLSDSYIGSVALTTERKPVVQEEKIIFRDVTYTPGLYKIFDEIIVNARDHKVRDDELKHIKVDISGDSITVLNDGSGIEVAKHEEHDMYVPELIFGNLLTSANYDTSETDRTVGGRNGFGAKLTNIFSTVFIVETVDATRKKRYAQTWRNNMTIIEKPKITSCSTKPYTKITFTPDFPRFELQGMTDDIRAIFEKRVYDLAASTPSDVIVTLNGKVIKMKGFDKYVDYWLGSKAEAPRVYEKINDRWEIAIAISPDGRYNQVSFVNGICTHLGGKHVDHITNQVTKKLVDLIAKKKKKTIKSIYIKDNIWVFVNSIISNPSFESQSKNSLTTPVTKFGSKADVSDAFIEKLAKSGLVDKALELLFAADDKILAKSDGVKKTNLKGIPKLDDAIKAGTNESQKCTLIITEGDSAKAFAVAGLSVIGRQYYGVVPVRGKPLNVREATPKQILENAEFNMLKSVLGLKQGVVYKDTHTLRYGSILVLCDAGGF